MRTSGPLACFLGLGLAVACSTGDSFAERVRVACEHLYDVHLERSTSCGFANIGLRADYVDTCTLNATAPGSGTTIAQLTRCADDLVSTKACSPFQVPSCAAAPGTIEVGTRCGVDSQCRSRHCVVMGGDCGRCREISPEGYPCADDGACEVGLFCDLGVCHKRKFVDVGAACTPDDICPVGAYCSPAGTCTSHPGEGANCADGGCAKGLICRSGKCSAPLDLGAKCASSSECKQQLQCDVGTHTCAPLRVANAGEPCLGEQVRCADGLLCLSMGCGHPRPRGAECADFLDCAPPLTCIDHRCAVADPARCQ